MHTLELQVDDLVELFLGGVDQTGEQAPARGVDGGIDPAHLGHGSISQRPHFGPLGNVAQRIVPADFGGERLQRFFLAAGDHYLGPFAREQAGNRLAHVVLGCGAQNHRLLACQTAHCIAPKSCDERVLPLNAAQRPSQKWALRPLPLPADSVGKGEARMFSGPLEDRVAILTLAL